MDNFKYSLRIAICPDFHPEEKITEILAFCKQASIDDIQFFINMEEINDGHLTPGETQPWLDMLAGFKSRVKEAGMTFSLNPWVTTLHTDRGRHLKPGQNFTVMTDYNGQKARAVACPLCKNFEEYISDMYQRYAQVGFDIIWVEDDFRLHNHVPLAWGGCFCDIHMAEFSKKSGKKLTREEFYKGIVAGGEPHVYRKIWLDTARDTMTDFAKLLGDAVHSVAPDTRVALMSSAPETHCSEGRDWKAVMENLSGKNRPLNRPHLPAYNENVGFRYCLEFQRFSRLSAYMVPEETELWPELDNFPHTRFSKSHRFTGLEMESALAICSEGITINIFDMIGNGIAACEQNDGILRELKPYLNGVLQLGAKRQQEQGVCVMFDANSSYTLHADERPGLKCIEPAETFWAEYLSAFGIANHYCTDRKVQGQTVAVGGQYLRNLTCQEIRCLFDNNIVWLNGDAVEVLVEVGMGDIIGAKNAEWLPLNDGRHCYEQVVDGEVYHGLKEARMSAQAIDETAESGDYLRIDYSISPYVYTELKNQKGEFAGVGLCTVGNVVIFPYGHLLNSYMQLLNPVRRELLTAILRKQENCPLILNKSIYTTVNDFALTQNRRMLLVTNYTTDVVKNLEFILPYTPRNCYMVERKTGELALAEAVKIDGGIQIPYELQPLTSACYLMELGEQ